MALLRRLLFLELHVRRIIEQAYCPIERRLSTIIDLEVLLKQYQPTKNKD